MKYSELVKQGQRKLFKAGIMDSDLDAWILVEKICNISRTEYFVKMHDEVPEEMVEQYFAAIDKRITHYPIQYIIGEWSFMGLPFKVNENVLVPRQDTEVLVEKAMRIIREEMPDPDKKEIRILDMCTGSGCIGISLAKNFQNVFVVGADISKGALEIAKENAELNGVNNIEFIESDLYSKVQGKFDILISNPPYIKSADIEELMSEVKDYEPRIALDGSEDGLEFYRRIIEKGKEFIKEDGYILFEIGYDQREQVKELLREKGYSDIEALKDFAGNDRVVLGKRRKRYV